ncbi:gamma-glutamyl-gamma-aminobutyrate hydrolase family protein [Amycolatopsis taiwanensis]|uniref:Glutamine amidotransferase n=1 Tax=Amycolatopsis taiwanensis TaxID=342230 RepID=A0A9W6QY50_9PSEU|nr:gamma-glutamyl-gamma-aminobutyrate hydrolase family protein [Amycolatopsis taiwanensis]GLY65868.1 glutamine amidotransferase [Amycolatopsis taiwanensis]
MTHKPLIGLSGRRQLAGPSAPPSLADAVVEVFFADYAASVAAAGGIPVLLSMDSDPRAVVDRLDGLLLSGGADIDPRRYGRAPGPEATPLDPRRDAFEFALLEAATTSGLPVLGICRGAQLINLSRGGTLVPHLPPDAGEAHSFLGYPRGHRAHPVALAEGSIPHALFGANVTVNSLHHQAVDEVGHGLRVVGRAPDGVVEAIEADGAPTLGVQWHPEMFDTTDPLFHWLVDQARLRCNATQAKESEYVAIA